MEKMAAEVGVLCSEIQGLVVNMDKFTKRFRQLVDYYPSRSEFARKTGFSRVSVDHWYKSNRLPSAENLYEICRTLNVSSDWLLGLSDNVDITTEVSDKLTILQATHLTKENLERIINANNDFMTLTNNVIEALFKGAK